MEIQTLDALSPVDGRYASKTNELRPYFSERALIHHRIIMEVYYLIHLGILSGTNIKMDVNKESFLEDILKQKDIEEIAKKIETHGHEDILATNHDVKSVEYLIAHLIKGTDLEQYTSHIHLGLTSEDTTSTAISLMVMRGLNDVMIPELSAIINTLDMFAQKYAHTAMLARTHGQAATPTTLGKEFANVSHRLKKDLYKLKRFSMPTKLNGASGNYNAHTAAYPDIDWISFSDKYIQSMAKKFGVNLESNIHTIQIEPHDGLYELFSIMKHINIVLLDFSNDMWSYISEDWIVQVPVEGEVGSSTMPHKVNPIDFENAEGNIHIANGFFNAFDTLPISRRQRDLSDSTILRNIGPAFGHCLIAYKSMLKGFGKVEAGFYSIKEALNSNPEVITEAIQTILRSEGVPNAYELLKDLSRGKKITLRDIYDFIDTLPTSDKAKVRMKQFTPENYTGLASKLAVM